MSIPTRYWLVHPNGGRQLVNPQDFDLTALESRIRALGGALIVENVRDAAPKFEPPVSALGPLFRQRLDSIHRCEVAYRVEMNVRPTRRVLGGYYKHRALIRVYTHDRETGRRPLEELFDTFLHEVAHHLEYTEPAAFLGRRCGRVRGRMHSPLFWRILGELKGRWAESQRRPRPVPGPAAE